MMKKTYQFYLGIGLSFLLLFGLTYLWAEILTPFVFAALLAYLLNPLVEKILHCKVPRVVAVTIVLLLLLCVILLLLLALLPLVKRQFGYLLQQLPDILTWLQDQALPWINQYVGIDESIGLNNIKQAMTDYWQSVTRVLMLGVQSLSSSGMALVNHIINLFLLPVVLFYSLRDWPEISVAVEKTLPRSIAPVVQSLCQQCAEVLSAFFRGQLLVMLLLAIFYSVGLSLLGLQLALMIGLLAGLFSVVPYLGFMVGLGAAIVVGIFQFHDVTHLLYIIIVFAVGNVLEGMVLTPWLIGNKIGLHPVLVIFAILACGQMLGFVGVLLALPIAAVLMVLLRYAYTRYQASDVYQSIGVADE